MSLRDLDAKFYEVVLEYPLAKDRKSIDGRAFYASIGQPHRGGSDLDCRIRHVHASLDAVWQGVEKLSGSKLATVDLVETAMGWCCDLGWGPVSDRGCAECDNPDQGPALAILKACLLAKGVTEQEIKETEGR